MRRMHVGAGIRDMGTDTSGSAALRAIFLGANLLSAVDTRIEGLDLGEAPPDAWSSGFSDAAASLACDITAVLDAASPGSIAISALASRATSKLDIALREAAGSPEDDRWLIAFDALNDLVASYMRCTIAPGGWMSLLRLAKFVGENSDLALPGAQTRRP